MVHYKGTSRSIREPYFMNSTTNGKYSQVSSILRSPT